MHCIGHRGAAGLAPQNTLASINAAIKCGCKWIEIDIWNVNNQLVVFHDRRLEKLTGGKGLLVDQSRIELEQLRVEGAEPIPTLEQVLDHCTGKIGVNVELKGPGCAVPLSSLIRQRRTNLPDLLISSFDHYQLNEFHVLCPQTRIGVLIAGYPNGYLEFARKISAASVHLHIDFVQKKAVSEIQASNMKAFVFTVNHEDDIKLMQQLGVDAVFSDFPDRVFAACGPYEQQTNALF